MKNRKQSWKVLLSAVVAVVLFTGMLAATSPAISAAPVNINKIWKKIKPKADKRYYTKAKSDARYAKKPTTVRGVYALSMQPGAAGVYGVTGISFGVTLPGSPVAHYIRVGDPVPAECAGGTAALPQAAAGNLCVFEGYQTGADDRGLTLDTYSGVDVSNRMGAVMFASSSGVAQVRITGGWAVGTGSSAAWKPLPKSKVRPGS